MLFICTGNAGRSQIAQALAEALVPEGIEVVSAGVDPWEDLHPMARVLLEERGIDLEGRRPKHVNTFAGTPLHWVVTIGDRARDETPPLDADAIRAHWDIGDPADADGTGREEVVFRSTLARIEEGLPDLIAQARTGPHPADLRGAAGMSTCVFRPPGFDPGEHMPAVARAGFECIELCLFRGSDDFPWDRPRRVDELRKAAEDTGIPIVAVHAVAGIGGTRGGASERLSVDLQKAGADVAAELGAPLVVMHAGLVKDAERPAAVRELRRSLDELARHVRPLPCLYGWENEAPGLTVDEHAQWIRDLGPDAFGFLLDNGHSHVAGTTEAYLEACKGLIRGVHLHDNNGQKDEHQLPGNGNVPWPRLMPALARAGYSGPLMLEFGPRPNADLPSLLACARDTVSDLRRLGEAS